jgi:hypothetical protein
MKFIPVTPIYYNSAATKYQESDSKILLAVDSIEQIVYPDLRNKISYYTIWIKGKGHQDTIKTFEPIVDKLNRS